jgi:hypothetical protein
MSQGKEPARFQLYWAEYLAPQEYKAVARQVTEIILRGCGLTPPAQI